MNMNKENKNPEGTGIMACDSINSKVVNPVCKQVYHSLILHSLYLFNPLITKLLDNLSNILL